MKAGDLQLKRASKAMADGRLADARVECSQALQRAPTSPEAFLLLGEIAKIERDIPQALQLFERAKQLDPRNPIPLIALAGALLLVDQSESARLIAHQADKLAPRDARSIDALGIVFSQLHEYEQAVRCFEIATSLAPRKSNYLFNLGCAQQFVGAFDLAARAFQRSIDIDPTFEPSYLVLVEMTPQTLEQNFIPALQRLFADAVGDPVRRLTIGHALAKSFDDLDKPEKALEWLKLAKAERRRRAPYQISQDREIFAAAVDTLSHSMEPTTGVSSDRPIFIVGMPRSGTTLTDRILSSHPQVASIGEAVTFPLLVKNLAGDNSPRLLNPEILRCAASKKTDQLGRAYLKAAEDKAGTAQRFIDKLPFNFLYAGLIHRALPHARIICLKRNPLDICLSNYRTRFGDGASFHDYAYDLEDIARYYLMFDQLINRWRSHLPSDRFTEVEYEALVADQEGETRRLLSFCGLGWDERCLSFHDNGAGVATASARQVRSPMFDTSIGRWRRYSDGLKPAINLLTSAGLIAV